MTLCWLTAAYLSLSSRSLSMSWFPGEGPKIPQVDGSKEYGEGRGSQTGCIHGKCFSWQTVTSWPELVCRGAPLHIPASLCLSHLGVLFTFYQLQTPGIESEHRQVLGPPCFSPFQTSHSLLSYKSFLPDWPRCARAPGPPAEAHPFLPTQA